MKVKTLKKGSVIRGVDFSSNFYARLWDLTFAVSAPEELVRIKEEEPETFKSLLETIVIVMQTLDDAAEKQGLVEEVENL